MIVITNRKLCNDFYNQMKEIVKTKPNLIIIREKDLGFNDMKPLAQKIITLGHQYGIPVSMNSNIEVAISLGMDSIHLPLQVYEENKDQIVKHFSRIGVSVHSVEEAKYAEKLGVHYVIAGHIFATDCKKGVAPRGISFLTAICNELSIPVYAIGGINSDNVNSVLQAGATDFCVMSGVMQATCVETYMKKFIRYA